MTPRTAVTAVAAALFASAAAGGPLPSAFSYQGRLSNAGTPINGAADFEFTLWNADVGGNMLGSPNAIDDVSIVDGLFTVQLDFGVNPFNGQALWLEIATRSPAGGGAFQTLSPRQAVTATPYALALRGVRTAQPGNDVVYPDSWNVIGGHPLNNLGPGVSGATIAGGGEFRLGIAEQPNLVTGDFGTISGGADNSAGFGAAVGGGRSNDATGNSSAIAGGWTNQATAIYSMIPGGVENRAHGEASLAAGTSAQAIHDGAFVWADNQFGTEFASTGTNQFLIRATGGVGIGTNAPTDPLTVAGVIRSTTGGFELPDGTIIEDVGDLGVGDITAVNAGNGLSGGGTSGSVTLNVRYSGTGTAAMAARSDHYHSVLSSAIGSEVVYVDGNRVGIETPTPYATLDINGTLVVGSDAPGSAMVVTHLNQVGIGGVPSPDATLHVNGSVKVDGTTLIVDDVNHRVGIGTNSPNAALTVNALALADAAFEIERDELTYADTRCRMGISGGSGGALGLRMRMSSNDGADWTDAMFFGEDGNVGIFTTAPQAKLHVGEGDSSGEIRIGLNPHLAMDREVAANKFRIQIAGNNYGGRYLQLGRDDGNHDVVVTGSLGVGTSAPAATLDVAGSLRVDGATLNVSSSNNRVGIGTTSPTHTLQVIGNACATGTISVCSDRRFKKDFESIADPLSLISDLRGVRFNWRVDEFPDHQFSEEPQVGFIAQEIDKVLPQVVSEGSDGYLSVDYGRLTPVIIEAIKQLQDEKNAQIESLREENAALRARSAELEQRLERIEQLLIQTAGGIR